MTMPEPDDRDSPRDGGHSRRPDPARDRDARTGRGAAAARMAHQQSWVDQQIRVAMAKGEFDDLPGAGKPIKDLGTHHDPDWWLKQLVEREQITGVLPPSLQLRKDDAELDARSTGSSVEREVRREVEDFNDRVIRARYSPPDGPAADHDASRRRRGRSPLGASVASRRRDAQEARG